MACPTPTVCPLCWLPMTDAECESSPPGEYPTHRACREELQEDEEERDDD